jgi:RND family efflux transporter MFP subunit
MTPDREQQLRSDLASLRIERNQPAPRSPRKSRRWVIPIVLVLGLIGGVAVWAVKGRTTAVVVAYATKSAPGEAGPIPVLSGSGYVVTGDRYVSVGVRVAGRIDRYFVEEGQSVRKGDELVQLDDRDYQAAVAATEARIVSARANLALAEAELRRGRTLSTQGVISQQELDVQENKAAVARAEIVRLEAELRQTKVNLDYTTLRAPTDGVILAKLKEVGEIAVPGGFAGSGDLIRLANLSDMRAEVDINEADLNRIELGQPARVTPDAYPDKNYDAAVVKLYPQVDRQKGTLKVEVQIREPDEKLMPDMSARITFLQSKESNGEHTPAVLIPAAAAQRDEQGDTFVWVVDDDRVRRQTIETGGDAGDNVRVASGLKGGEAVVVGNTVLRDGQRVVAEQSMR